MALLLVLALASCGCAAHPGAAVIEGVTVGLILVIAVVVLVRLAAGTAPAAEVDLSVFKRPSGTDNSALFLGIVFGFLSFAGFEAAATLGEEARTAPRRSRARSSASRSSAGCTSCS